MTTQARATLLEQQPNHVTLSIQAPAELLYFAGHFPETPVLPGVVQIDWAIHYARQYFDMPANFAGMEAVLGEIIQKVSLLDNRVTKMEKTLSKSTVSLASFLTYQHNSEKEMSTLLSMWGFGSESLTETTLLVIASISDILLKRP